MIMWFQRASKGQQRRGLITAELYRLFIRYILTEQMPTDLELTTAKFDKTNDARQTQQKANWQTRPPNCKTAAKFRHWAKSLDVSSNMFTKCIIIKVVESLLDLWYFIGERSYQYIQADCQYSQYKQMNEWYFRPQFCL